MTIRIGRTLPPAAAPIPLSNVLRALPECFRHDGDVSRFEGEIIQEFRQRYCVLVSSGKAALVLILKALQNLYPERDEVVVSAFTCFSVPAAIKKAGLKIKLCDTGAGSLDPDKKQLREIIESDKKDNKILCVLVTHLFGCPADYSGIKQIVGTQIPIVEDAAQAMGQEIDGKRLGTLGDVGFFSLGRGKALSTIEGGVILSSREDLGNELIRLSSNIESFTVFDKIKFGVKSICTTLFQQPFIFCLPKALPFLILGETLYEEDFSICKMSSLQMRLARNWRERLQRHQDFRRKNIRFWQETIPQKFSLVCPRTKEIAMIRFPLMAPSKKERDMICLKSEENGCGVMPTYPSTINEIPQLASEIVGQHYPNAKKLADCLFTLPAHEYVRESDRLKILNLLNS